MKLKNYENRNENVSEEEIEVIYRKAQLKANSEYEYQKLGSTVDGLLNCTLEIIDEDIKFIYDVGNVKKWECLGLESKELRLAVLCDVKRLMKVAMKFCIKLNPENLFYDIQGRVYVRDRDVYGIGEGFTEEEFCRQYKALAGCTMWSKYQYEDIYEGGLDLLKENDNTKEIVECESATEICNLIKKQYEDYKEIRRTKYVEVGKQFYKAQKGAFAVVIAISVAALVLCGYIAIWKSPYETAVAKAYEEYLQSDYEGTIAAMSEVSIGRMNNSQKYILAVSSVKCENFNTQNQNSILRSISLNGDEKVMEYWIHVNRLELAEAEDIAMQLSSDQLLYYAYLKEKVVVENDSALTGEEKQTRIAELESKLEPLKKEYSSLTEE